jgi:alpha-1,6-mannosyltransferase
MLTLFPGDIHIPMRPPDIAAFLASVVTVTLGLGALHVLPLHPAVALALVFIGSSAAYLWLCRETLRADMPAWLVWAVLGLGILIRLSFFATDPVGSDDVYRYVWDGKVQAAGINPYRYAPSDPALAGLHSSLLPEAVNHPDMKTVYFPFSQWLFLLAFRMAGESLWALKAMLLAAEAATIAGLLLLLAHLKLPRRLVLLYALCPLPILAFALDAHVDGFGLPLLIFGLLYYLRGRTLTGLLLLGLSLSVKPVALVVLPVLFFRARTTADRARIALLPPAVALLPFVPYALGVNPFESLSTFAWNWLFNGAFFELVRSLVQDNQRARVICAVALAATLLLVQFTRHDTLRKAAFSIFLLLLFSPVVHPWYVTWLVVLLPVVPLRSGMVYAASVSLAIITLVGYRLTGTWEQHPVILVVEYAPVVILFLLEVSGKLPVGTQNA